MRVVQIVLPGASAFELKCQRVDFAGLSERGVPVLGPQSSVLGVEADIAHVYGPSPLPAKPFVGFSMPYVASSGPEKARFSFRSPVQPAAFVNFPDVPEAVEDDYFLKPEDRGPRTADKKTIGSYQRPAIMNIVEQTLARISRFRDDITWHLFDRPPSPTDLAGVDVWADPALDDKDLDGFVAEAIAAGKISVASRTAMNLWRLEQGRTGLLVPHNDPNELCHAILAALFKPEVAHSKIEAALQTAGKFRPRQRIRILERIYQTLIS